MKNYSELHDSILSKIEVNWESGQLSIKFGDEVTGSRPIVVLLGHNVSSFRCERKLPWGPSVSVNHVKCAEIDGGFRLEVEMQSGDIITATMDRFEFLY
jgi:hypothetical protein